jgi:hypothetical protein
VEVWGASIWLDVTTGSFHTCGLKSDGTLFCWGGLGWCVCGGGGDGVSCIDPNASMHYPAYLSLPTHTCIAPPTHTSLHTRCEGHGPFKAGLVVACAPLCRLEWLWTAGRR